MIFPDIFPVKLMDLWGGSPFPMCGTPVGSGMALQHSLGSVPHLRAGERCCQGRTGAAGPILGLLSSPHAASQGCHPWGALGRQLGGLNPSSAFCHGDRRVEVSIIHSSPSRAAGDCSQGWVCHWGQRQHPSLPLPSSSASQPAQGRAWPWL